MPNGENGLDEVWIDTSIVDLRLHAIYGRLARAVPGRCPDNSGSDHTVGCSQFFKARLNCLPVPSGPSPEIGRKHVASIRFSTQVFDEAATDPLRVPMTELEEERIGSLSGRR